MKKLFAFIILFVYSALSAQEFTPKEITPLFDKSFNEIAYFISSKLYSYVDTDGSINTYKRASLILNTSFKKDRLSSFSTQEYVAYFNNIVISLKETGFVHTQTLPEQYSGVAPRAAPGLMYKFENKKLKINCIVICPVNLGNGTMLFSVNYTTY